MLKNSLLNVQKKGVYFSALASKLVNSKFNLHDIQLIFIFIFAQELF